MGGPLARRSGSRGEIVSLGATCLTRDQANAWIEKHHRHHKRVSGHRFIVGAMSAGELVGIAVAGRPRARLLQQYENLEVNRLCSDGSRNVCSFLYSRVSRIAQELGFTTCFTAILESEPGTSLRASGWLFAYSTKGGTQDRPSRRREDKSPIEPKQIWAAHWCLDAVRALNTEQASKAKACDDCGQPTGSEGALCFSCDRMSYGK